MSAVDALLIAAAAALLFILAALLAVTRMHRNGPSWPDSSAHDAADDSGEAASAPRQAVRASGSQLPAADPAPASPHPGSLFLDPDGICAWCFQPRSECQHRPREFFIST